MSDFVPRDLWDEILRRHWTYLETEASLEKLEECKKLEGCLKEFLCIVPHDRKFFLPETAHVLRKSICELENFTASKGIVGFESISQYANNLFTKPWRKEFRILKMYSGFFQHEIKSNLIDAEKLFEAMGYRRLSDEMLVLDGPICPDQVTNVSRDAMAAYVECKIIRHIYTGLQALGVNCSWQDVYNYREKYVGGTTQTIKGMAYAIQERRLRKEKLMSADNCYATIQHPSQVPTAMMSQCQNCTPYHMTQPHHMQQQQQPNGQCALHSNNSVCALHPAVVQQQPNMLCNGGGGGGAAMSGMNGKLIASYPAPANYQQHQQQHNYAGDSGMQPHMSHSRSLEHYNEPLFLLPHRHSFDHQQQGCTAHHYQQSQQQPQHVYESPYDCIDGASVGSSVSYAAVAASGANLNAAYTHPYNVSGNRYPLPYNISNQLNSGINNMDNAYATVSKPSSHNCNYHAQPPVPPTRQITSAAPAHSRELQALRHHRSFPPDHLIDFDERAKLTEHDFHAQMHTLSQKNSLDYERGDHMYDRRGAAAITAGGLNHTANVTYAQPRDVCHHVPQQLPANDEQLYDNYLYARPTPRGTRGGKASLGPNNMTDKYLRNSEILQETVDNKRKMQMELKDGTMNGAIAVHDIERDTSDASYESTLDDFVNVCRSEHPQHVQRSPTQASKNQDGVGSFETWNYVFKNLEKSGYTKDLGERGDLLVQGLDLDALSLANESGKSTEKRRTNQQQTQQQQQPTLETSKSGRTLNGGERTSTLEKTGSTNNTAGEKRMESGNMKSNLKQGKTTILKQHNASATNGVGAAPKKKSALKSSNSHSLTANTDVASYSNGNERARTASTYNRKATTNSTSAAKPMSSGNSGEAAAARMSTRANNTTRLAGAATQVIVSSPSEWSCRFCTFLNPDTTRICEMCCRTKNCNIEATVTNTPTCV